MEIKLEVEVIEYIKDHSFKGNPREIEEMNRVTAIYNKVNEIIDHLNQGGYTTPERSHGDEVSKRFKCVSCEKNVSLLHFDEQDLFYCKKCGHDEFHIFKAQPEANGGEEN
jgi:Zn finger protein HypA/HybF involved in hydrogenase expression